MSIYCILHPLLLLAPKSKVARATFVGYFKVLFVYIKTLFKRCEAIGPKKWSSFFYVFFYRGTGTIIPRVRTAAEHGRAQASFYNQQQRQQEDRTAVITVISAYRVSFITYSPLTSPALPGVLESLSIQKIMRVVNIQRSCPMTASPFHSPSPILSPCYCDSTICRAIVEVSSCRGMLLRMQICVKALIFFVWYSQQWFWIFQFSSMSIFTHWHYFLAKSDGQIILMWETPQEMTCHINRVYWELWLCWIRKTSFLLRHEKRACWYILSSACQSHPYCEYILR